MDESLIKSKDYHVCTVDCKTLGRPEISDDPYRARYCPINSVQSYDRARVDWSRARVLHACCREKTMEPPRSCSQDITPALVLNTGLNISNRPVTVTPQTPGSGDFFFWNRFGLGAFAGHVMRMRMRGIAC